MSLVGHGGRRAGTPGLDDFWLWGRLWILFFLDVTVTHVHDDTWGGLSPCVELILLSWKAREMGVRKREGFLHKWFGEVCLGSEGAFYVSQEMLSLLQGWCWKVKWDWSVFMSQLYRLSPVQPWTGPFTSLSLSIHSCKLQNGNNYSPKDWGDDSVGLAVSYQFLFSFPALLLTAE